MAPSCQIFDGKGRTDVEISDGAVEHIWWSKKPAAVALIWSTGPITVQKSIVPACIMRFNIRTCIASVVLMVEGENDPKAVSVCFDIPGSCEKRREAADLDLGGLQSFNTFVKRAGFQSVLAITVSTRHAEHALTWASREVSSTRESDTTTESPINCIAVYVNKCKTTRME